MVEYAVATDAVGEAFIVGTSVQYVTARGIRAVQCATYRRHGTGGVVAAWHMLVEIAAIGLVARWPVACCRC